MELFGNKVAWVTGASSGIGEALCFRLANLGCRLVISSNQPVELAQVERRIQESGKECKAIAFDLSEPESVKAATIKAIEAFGRIDMLFNNGGISQRSLVSDTPVMTDRKIMEINYFANIAITKAILPQMIRNGGGHIVVTSSLSGLFGFPLRSAYCASKHALHGFYETLRIEHLKDNIRVTIVCPDRVRTNISIHALSKDGTPHGKMDSRQDRGITADQCAGEIIRAVRKNKIIKLIGGSERIAVYLKRYIPGLFYRLISRVNPE